MSRHHQKPRTMSRDASGWQLRRVLGSIGTVIVICGIATLFTTVPAIDSAPAAQSAQGVTVSPGENNWG